MCSMKCFQNKNKNQSSKSLNTTNTDIEFVVDFLKKKFSTYLKNKNAPGFKCFHLDVFPCKYYCVDLCRNVIICVNEEMRLKKFLATQEHYKFFTIGKGLKVVVKTPEGFTAEGLFDIFNDCKQTLTFCTTMITNAISKCRNMKRGLSDPQVDAWLMDFLAILVELVDPYSYGVKRIILMLTRIYSLVKRYNIWYETHVILPMYRSETLLFTSLSEIAMAFAAIGLPDGVVQLMKNFSFLTGARITETNIFMEAFTKLVEIIYGIIEWIHQQNFIDLSFLVDLLSGLNGYVGNYKNVKEVTELYTKYVKNPQVMLDVQYRQKVMDLDAKTKGARFLEYINNDNNKYFRHLYTAFKDNVVRYAETFDVSVKEEPICIVFEGAPGTGKSVLMNAVVDMLRESKSVYVHTTPGLDNGKDFYDDYLNQHVFVMDDVGQQAVSQWRNIINFVSPVKYPLECATAEKKNTKFFNSKIILCTTNSFKHLALTSTDGIADVNALYRRAHVIDTNVTLRYFKFDYRGGVNRWIHDHIDPYKEFCQDLPTQCPRLSLRDQVVYILKLIGRLEIAQKSIQDRVALKENDKEYIRNALKNNDFMDAQTGLLAEGYLTDLGELIYDEIKEVCQWEPLVNGMSIFKEFVVGIIEVVTSTITEVTSQIMQMFHGIFSGEWTTMFKYGSMFLLSISVVYFVMYLKDYLLASPVDEMQVVIQQWKDIKTTSGWFSQGISTVKQGIQNNMRFIKIESYIAGKKVVEYCQTLVSGKRILLPFHVLGSGAYASIYRDWDAYLRNEIELESIPLKIVQSFPVYDLVVCELDKLTIPLYKLAHCAFANGVNSHNNLSFVNCFHDFELISIGGYNVNKSEICVRSLKGKIQFPGESGLVYPLSSKGLCGSLIVSDSQGLVAMHAAGDGKDGFAVMFPKNVRDSLYYLLIENNRGSKYELRELGKEFSGTRMIYEVGEIEKTRALQESALKPTLLNSTTNADIQRLHEELQVGYKYPPNFVAIEDNAGKTLQKLSEKSFMPMGKVTDKELEYGMKVLDSYLVDFTDVTMEEAIFGDDELKALNKDSSNGYGWKNDKLDIFDYENKQISDEFLKVMNDFELQAKTGNVDIKHILARETFKDELRLTRKKDIPRTFRVLPVQHIVATKMCIGNLFKHIRKNMWDNGIAIGMNPYKDWDRLYSMMVECEGVFDIDFGKWDGKVHAKLQDAVNKVVLKRYKGKHRELFEVVLNSIVRGNVLVGDALYSTTHSLPSGTWVTALFNSFMNKIVSAMAYYRAWKNDDRIGYTSPQVVDFKKDCLDFAMGDDKLCGARRGGVSFFNAITVKNVAEDLGMDCTDGMKNEIKERFVPLDKVVFLKRNFRYNHDLRKVMCPLSLETIVNSLEWCDKTKDIDVVIKGKCIAAQIEMFIHNEKLRDEIYYIIKKVYPLVTKMENEQIIDILQSDEGYAYVMRMLGKFTIENI